MIDNLYDIFSTNHNTTELICWILDIVKENIERSYVYCH